MAIAQALKVIWDAKGNVVKPVAPHPEPSPIDEADQTKVSVSRDDGDAEKQVSTINVSSEAGVLGIEAAQAIWGKKGRWLIIAGEIDNTTLTIYNNYSTSSFNALSKLASLGTASAVIFAVVKPPIAKLSNVIGRGQTYCFTISCYVLAYILMASAKTFNHYAAGSVFYTIGQSGTNIMNDIVISDITTARWRGFAIGLSFFPFLITPWVAAFIIESVVSPAGIGWRWGIGMFAILMPFGASFIITTLLYYQSRAKKMKLSPRAKITVREFCSQIDLGGIILFCGGFAMLLLPLTLAAQAPHQWQTPYVIALIVVGGLLLIALPFYEKLVARHPIVPVQYFRNRTIVLCLFLIATDSLGFSCTHTYIYTWITAAHGFGPRDATFYNYTNGVMQCLVGILAGLAMIKTRRFKWLTLTGAVVRLIGYGVMIRLRGATNSVAELFLQQVIQGIGSGMIQTTLLVPAQIVVPHAEMPQITALVICFSFLGGSIGACIAGGIYTNTLVPALWKYLPEGTSVEVVEGVFNSITGVLPEWGTLERTAVSFAFTDVMRYMTFAALGASAPAVILAFFMPNLELPERNNLVEE